MELDRRILTVLHVAMLSAVAVYALVLWALRAEVSGPAPGGAAPKGLEWAFLAIGTAQYFVATELGKKLLPSRRGEPQHRVRSYFLIRFAAAEAIGIYGLMLGFLGASAGWVAALLGLSVVTLLLAAPTRAAYDEALALAQQSRS
jgi:F0F1-type ATP synthase membrane subunit c/vacuolar-type H+-ATPase subunit K